MIWAAAILAGGTGVRMGSPIPKQFLELAGRPVIIRSLEAFRAAGIDFLAVVIHPDWRKHLLDLAARWGLTDIHVVPGGPARQDSARHAVEYLAGLPHPPDAVLLHDAARCLVSVDIIRRCQAAVLETGAATAAIPAVDTMALVADGLIRTIPDRRDLWRLQTPQAFLLPLIREAHARALERGVTGATDDTRLLLDLDRPVRVVEGAPSNIKISTPEDLPLAERLLLAPGPA